MRPSILNLAMIFAFSRPNLKPNSCPDQMVQMRQNKIKRTDLTHWGRVTHICVSKLTIIGSDNELSPNRRQAIIWTNAGILLIGPLGTNLGEIWIEIQIYSFRKMHLKLSSAKWRPFCLGLNVVTLRPKSAVEMVCIVISVSWTLLIVTGVTWDVGVSSTCQVIYLTTPWFTQEI